MKMTLSLVLGTALTLLTLSPSQAPASALSIPDIQYTTDPDGISPHLGATVDCAGGIVIKKYPGFKPRIMLYDPASPTGWGGLVVKDFTFTDAFASVNVGDWVSVTGTEVEEAYGNTQLKYLAGSTFAVTGTGNPMPTPIVVTEFTEQHEAMVVQVTDVVITAQDLGSHGDNYNLHNSFGDFWAADYMNVDAQGPYHDLVIVGNAFESVSGIIEANSTSDFQLLTRSAVDFVVPEPATLLLILAGAVHLRRRRGN